MYLRLEKIDPAQNHWRWYVLSVQPTLFDEWSLIREWGRLGNEGGESDTTFYASRHDALSACGAVRLPRCGADTWLRPNNSIYHFGDNLFGHIFKNILQLPSVYQIYP